MSSCLIIGNRNNIFIGADTAASMKINGEFKRSHNHAKKLYNYTDSIVFYSGKLNNIDIINDYINNNGLNINNLSEYLRYKFKYKDKSQSLFDLEIIIVNYKLKIINQLSQYNNYVPQEYILDNNLFILTSGYKTKELYNLAYNKLINKENIYDIYLSSFKKICDDCVGGNLILYNNLDNYITYNIDNMNNYNYLDSIIYVNADSVVSGIIIGGDIYSGNYSNTNNVGTHFDLMNGDFSLAGGKIKYDSMQNKVSLSGVELQWDDIDGTDDVLMKDDESSTRYLTNITEDTIKTTNVTAVNLNVKAANVDGKLSANQIKTDELIVGTNISMGPNAKISWSNVTNQPDIPENTSDLNNDSGYQNESQVTTISRNEISTATIYANQIDTVGLIAENISATTITGKTLTGSSITTSSDTNSFHYKLDKDGLGLYDGNSLFGLLSVHKGSGTGLVGLNSIDLEAQRIWMRGQLFLSGDFEISNGQGNGAFIDFHDSTTIINSSPYNDFRFRIQTPSRSAGFKFYYSTDGSSRTSSVELANITCGGISCTSISAGGSTLATEFWCTDTKNFATQSWCTNTKGFVTKSVSNLDNYYTKTEIQNNYQSKLGTSSSLSISSLTTSGATTAGSFSTTGTLTVNTTGSSSNYIRLYGYSSRQYVNIKYNSNTGVMRAVNESSGDVAWGSSSSKYVKKNIVSLTKEDAKKVLDLRPVQFDYLSNQHSYGLIAEEVEELLPELVKVPINYDEEKVKNGDHDNIKMLIYTDFIPYIIKLCQVQQDEIDILKAQILDIKGEKHG